MLKVFAKFSFLQVLSNLLTHLIFTVKEPKIITQLKCHESEQKKLRCLRVFALQKLWEGLSRVEYYLWMETK